MPPCILQHARTVQANHLNTVHLVYLLLLLCVLRCHAAPLNPATDPGTQCLAFLLFCWAVLGWLLPTLLLLPAAAGEAAADAPAATTQPGRILWRAFSTVADKLLMGIERGLATLQPPRLRPQQGARTQQRDDASPDRDNADIDGEESLTVVAAFVLAWCVVLLTTWMGSCSLAVSRMGSEA